MNYTLYGIIAGVAALLAVAMFVYPRYDRVQNFIRGRSNSVQSRDITTGRYKKASGLPRGRNKSQNDLRTENEILEAGRTRMDNL
jgi:hypothetical protein